MTKDEHKKSDDQDRAAARLPPRVVKVRFGNRWAVTTPTVYRYEDGNWIDEFFDKGCLRLSTFEKFSSYPDEVRGDSEEGLSVSYGYTQAGSTIVMALGQGHRSFVFCCSRRLSRTLQNDFGRNSAFEIMDTVGFSAAVARCLPSYRHGLEGNCIYRAHEPIVRNIDYNMEDFRRPDGALGMEMLPFLMGQLGGPEVVLSKRPKYREQQEYRLLWEVADQPESHIDIRCPEAVQFCRRVRDDEYSD